MYIRPEYHENGIYHVYNRGVAKLPTFLKESDYFDFREIMRYYLVGFPKREGSDPSQNNPKRHRMDDTPMSWKADPAGNGMFRHIIDLLAYCFMPNHFHFLVRICESPNPEINGGSDLYKRSDPPDLSCCIPEFMKRLSLTYAMKFNRDNNRVGPLFQGRFKIKPLETDELVMHVARYIHINPTMAGLSKTPALWPWSDLSDYYHFNPLSSMTLSKPLFVMEYFDRQPSSYRNFIEDQFSDRDEKIITPVAIDLDD